MTASSSTGASLAGKLGFFAPLDALLNDAEQRAIQQARAFCHQHVAAAAHAAFTLGEPYPITILHDWAAQRFLALQAPESAGGLGASFLCKVRLAQEVARHSFATAFSLNNLQGSVTRVARGGSARQQQAYLAGLASGQLLGAPALSEPQAGSDLSALSMRAERSGQR
ncbi:acyl-CoA dehydrogenase family protein [Achromobacter sp. AGC39]